MITPREFLIGMIAGVVSSAMCRWQHRRKPQPPPPPASIEREEFLRLLRAEYVYWREVPEDSEMSSICIGAMGSLSNVMAAVNGSLAPWHDPNFKHVPKLEEVSNVSGNAC